MSAVIFLLAQIILPIEFTVGITGNGLLTAVICIDWMKSTKLTSCDMILASLGISRILLQCLMIWTNFSNLATPVNCNLVFKMFLGLRLFLNLLSLWFATWLSVFYCVKIASFSQFLFLWLKQRISWLVPWLLMGTLFLSLCFSIPLVCMNYTLCDSNMTFSLLHQQDRKQEIARLYIVSLDTVGLFIPFLIFMVSTTLLITSLWRHTRQIQTPTSDFQTKAHVDVIKALIAFIVFYGSYWLTLISFVSFYFQPFNENMWFSAMVMAAYPSGHSVILILLNPKLKQGLLRILNPTKCCLKEEVS